MTKDAWSQRGVTRRHLLEANEVFVGAQILGGPLGYWDPDGRLLARIESEARPRSLLLDGVLHRPSEAWSVSARDGEVFALARYGAAEDPSFDVLSPEDAPLGTFLCDDGVFRDEIVVRDDATAPVGEVETRRSLHELRELHGPAMATCKRVLDRVGDDPLQEVWWLAVGDDPGLLDPRVVLALPMVCALTGPRKRGLDPGNTIAGTLLFAAPPVGAAMLLLESAIDGWYWLRRQLA